MAKPTSQKDELNRLVEVLDNLIAVPSSDDDDATLLAKIELLERALESWRFYANQPDNALSLETFTQCGIFVDGGRIAFRLPEKEQDLGAGTRPIRLQPPLLIFLLLYHRDQYVIYDIIQKFIEKVRGDLTILDFKRTRTGVMRCFTNTRFAALALRDHGLLKFTHREAFKTWVLSLPGILVASKVLEQDHPWQLPVPEEKWSRAVHPQILQAASAMTTFDDYLRQLKAVCLPNVEVFKTFDGVLRAAHRLLPGYWSALRSPKLTKKQRTEETTARLAELDGLPQMEEFYTEFSKCVNVEQLLKDIDAPPKPTT